MKITNWIFYSSVLQLHTQFEGWFVGFRWAGLIRHSWHHFTAAYLSIISANRTRIPQHQAETIERTMDRIPCVIDTHLHFTTRHFDVFALFEPRDRHGKDRVPDAASNCRESHLNPSHILGSVFLDVGHPGGGGSGKFRERIDSTALLADWPPSKCTRIVIYIVRYLSFTLFRRLPLVWGWFSIGCLFRVCLCFELCEWMFGVVSVKLTVSFELRSGLFVN